MNPTAAAKSLFRRFERVFEPLRNDDLASPEPLREPNLLVREDAKWLDHFLFDRDARSEPRSH